MSVPCRYGIEVEGPFKGDVTLIIPNAAQHTLEFVAAMMAQHSEARRPKHLWLEVQPHEAFDWDAIYRLKSKYRITLQVRTPQDLPPEKLLSDPFVAVVWMVPDEFAELLKAASYIKHATAPGIGFESRLRFVTFDPEDYRGDIVWPSA